MTFNIYKKGLQKGWLMGLIPPIIIALFIPFIAVIWPELKAQAEAFQAMLDNPFYQAFSKRMNLESYIRWLTI